MPLLSSILFKMSTNLTVFAYISTIYSHYLLNYNTNLTVCLTILEIDEIINPE